MNPTARKLTALSLAAVMGLGLAACSGGRGSPDCKRRWASCSSRAGFMGSLPFVWSGKRFLLTIRLDRGKLCAMGEKFVPKTGYPATGAGDKRKNAAAQSRCVCGKLPSEEGEGGPDGR